MKKRRKPLGDNNQAVLRSFELLQLALQEGWAEDSSVGETEHM
jgi:hypothetical protein